MTARGLFVSLEGGEGSGKSTQSALLAEKLRQQGHEVLEVREPGGTPLGEELRLLLLHRREAISVRTELLLFLAARAELVSSVIRPALSRGAVVICDRFLDSSLAYQGFGRGLDLRVIRRLNQEATEGLKPELTVLLDLPISEGRQRKAREEDAFQREEDNFHQRVRDGYLSLAGQEPSRWLILDGRQPPAQLANAIAERALALLAR